MAYNLSTVRTRIQKKLDDTNFSVATNNQFINDGQRDILNSRRFVFMEREATLTTTNGLDTVTGTPSDMQVPLTLRLYSPTNYATALPYLEYEEFDVSIPNPSLAGNTVPTSWRVFNKTIYVYPIANGTYTLKLKYIKVPAELVNDIDVPEIPEEFSEALVLAGYRRALEHNDNYDQAQVIQIQIDEQLNKMDERYKRQSGRPHIMSQPLRTNSRLGVI